MNIEIIWQGQNALGEGPMWHPYENVLYWIDIAKPSLHRLNPVTGHYHQWKMPDFIGAVVPRESGGVIITVGNAVFAVQIPSGKMTQLAAIEPWSDELRMNDGKCDRQGRFWIGVANLDTENPKGGLYRLDPDGTLIKMEEGITISNGLGWSPDNKIFYYTDGLKYCIYQYDFDLEKGTIANRRPFVQLKKSPIEPDGLTVDSEGYVWEAQWNSGKIFRYAPNGEVDRVIEMPVKRPTSCIFGGANLDRLYITSCSQGIGEAKTLPPPAGAVFAINVGVRGLPEPAFVG
ncbi:CBU_1789 family Dot/Icm type IV secretion system effector [Coxiella burnetii]|uniref:CBU_1789 family Dot/Icm type IV secretion system effector n=1 Tax=Coxiella burnetii TaxID=777 RepID=UPI000183CFEB|nr:CBU_1789 family Dot/Icm type IV secretion system effector [Coxiella burnetii]ACJ17618.1 gluconolactonase [Coxiella burnetii CbuG_Q212]ATN66075.1 gluconolactonase [Coxiella burnetii]OYK86900.1 gluconolactonase [Coxiella burnetii]